MPTREEFAMLSLLQPSSAKRWLSQPLMAPCPLIWACADELETTNGFTLLIHFQGPEGEIIEKGKLIETIAAWGPCFKISFDLFITSFGPSEWSSVLSFKGNGATKSCCSNGDRVPTIGLRSDGRLYFANSVNGNGNYLLNGIVQSKWWHKIEIEQTNLNGKVRIKQMVLQQWNANLNLRLLRFLRNNIVFFLPGLFYCKNWWEKD